VESGLRTPDPPREPGGLIVMVRPDPADAARVIAEDLHAELAIGGEETERALERLTARRLELHTVDLTGLAAAMRRAETIRDQTRSGVAAQLSRSLNTKVAIHPDTVRRSAFELLAAEKALDAALYRDHRRARRARQARIGGSASATTAGVATAAFAVVAPPVGVAIAAAGIAGAGASWVRSRRQPTDLHASLRSHCALARTRWEQVAGVGADPADAETIIHRYDPQDEMIAALVDHNPAVRAAERVAVQRCTAWVAAWRHEVGDSSPLTDPNVTELLQRDGSELWLTSGPFLGEEPETLVVAAPYADLPESRARELHRRLLGLPKGQRVIIVLAPDPGAPTGARIPGVGWVPAAAGP